MNDLYWILDPYSQETGGTVHLLVQNSRVRTAELDTPVFCLEFIVYLDFLARKALLS